MKNQDRAFRERARQSNKMTRAFTLMLKELKDGKRVSYVTDKSAIYVERCFEVLFNEKVVCTRLSPNSIKIELKDEK
jgi:hypothetical protein